MSIDGTKLADISVGQQVTINPQRDRSRKERVTGIVSEILTTTATHSHGILVKLESGETGRVKTAVIAQSIQPGSVDSHLHTEKSIIAPIEEIIKHGENHHVEYKSSMLWSERYSEEQIKSSSSHYVQQYGRAASKVIVAKTIAGFLNSDGGYLIIGIKENKDTNADEIIGVESEYPKLKDPCADGYRRKILDSIIKIYFPSFIFNHFNDYINIEFHEVDGKTLCRLRISKSDQKVFVSLNRKDTFFVRVDASTRQLHGEQIVDYCMKHFSN